MQLTINERSSIPKYRQIVDAVLHGIETGALHRDEQLPSINELSEEFYLARDTVEKAYKVLKKEGVIQAVRGKGYFIRREGPDQLRVLLIMNKLSAYKKIIYYALLDELGAGAVVDLRLHHHDAAQFAQLIRESQGEYNYYVVMPHFYEQAATASTQPANVQTLLAEIPSDKLVLLDKDLPDLKGNHIAVFQQFDRDLYEALESGADLLEKYRKLLLVFPKDVRYPPEIVRGFRNYAVHHRKDFAILATTVNHIIEPETAYIVLEDSDLAELVRQAKRQNLMLGRDVGILSFNETPLKEVLADGITVVSTDHEQMGRTAAQLMLDHRPEKVKNPFKLIRRGSL
ncbi:GntR family transcriptional regulator [Spirosoma endbachense]|uniref:GntR family transcriptional regulator n=1 Tax=Spirosoma endbachense TaxID=2666025 RepID=A0A6P1W938_9BACT|nr:GntR family transcriptional regulator [Spirosoma endbachense]QHW00903.1 GntR family transcriptional regulator [Spirosoma endbachense]